MTNVSNFRSQGHHDSSTHGLRFEAYGLPKPSVASRTQPVPLATSKELVPVSERTYPQDISHATSVSSVSEPGPTELRLQLDGIQKKWGRPTYSPTVPSNSNSSSQKPVNGVPQLLVQGTVGPQTRDVSYDSRKPQVEVPPEKQKLAASLFGGASSKTGKRPTSTNHKTTRVHSHAAEKSQMPTTTVASTEQAAEKASQPPSPDLLDLDEPTPGDNTAPSDPFIQLEGLLGRSDISSVANSAVSASKSSDVMSLYAESPMSGLGDPVANTEPANLDPINLLSSLSNLANRNVHGGSVATQLAPVKKGPNPQDSLEKDAVTRQVGVTPSGTNPNLFSDLLG
ncbi:AP-4 complex subunit epsilon-like [Macadamia integrifolia]|uniref:AP-4 complex subunit epsilon-like n=1 Tax=Macadamia integrifolia TaxID=60698 RepID=UPI001C4EF90D|nr:AP-4 complex subunit epsilon-like [Macadamia integrifolia]